jgi:hypothetical protein
MLECYRGPTYQFWKGIRVRWYGFCDPIHVPTLPDGYDIVIIRHNHC